MKAKAGLSFRSIKNKIDGLFPLKTFSLSLALLMFLLILTVGIYQLFMAEPVSKLTLTGKTIGTLDVVQKIEDQPIHTAPDAAPDVSSDEQAENHSTELTTTETIEKPPVAGDHSGPAIDPTEATSTVEDSIAGLSEQSPSGYLPIIRSSDNLKSFEAYKAPFKLKSDTRGVISLVMIDYGLSDNLSKTALETLPASTTFVASPYASNLQAKISGARARDMEVWMGLPMQGTENSGISNIGPNAILAGLNSKENMLRLNTHMGSATGYAGMAISVKPGFDKNSSELRSVINTLSARGLAVAELVPNDDVINMIAAQTNTPYINADLWIDTLLTKDDIAKALAKTEKSALENGYAVAVFHPSLLVNTAIANWQKSLASQNIQLAPLTYTTHIAIGSPQKSAPVAEKPAEETKSTKTETTSHGTTH